MSRTTQISIVATLFLIQGFALTGCMEDSLTAPETFGQVAVDMGGDREPAPVHAKYSKLRHPQMLEQAKTETVGKSGSTEIAYELVIGFQEFEADGVTRRVLDKYGITRRILDKYDNGPGARQARQRVEFDEVMKGIAIGVKGPYLDSLLYDLENDPDVAWVEADPVLNVNPPVAVADGQGGTQIVPWGVDRIGARLAGNASTSVHVVIMDSGITDADINLDKGQDMSMLFRNRDMMYWDDEFAQEAPVFDPKEEGDMRDYAGHGTHLAGTIGALNNSEGVIGVAPNVKLHSLKVMDEHGRTDITTTTAAIDLITHIKNTHPDVRLVVNMSLGADIGTTAYNALDEAVERAIDAGVVVIVSAGNNGQDASTYSPAHVEKAITVGAFDQSDRYADYSNYGTVVDIVAPGSDIVSLPHEFAPSTDEVLLSGTSSAAAHVTGAAALYLSEHPDATPEEVLDALISHSQPVVQDTPQGTTNKALYVGVLSRDESLDKDLDVTTARWFEGTNELVVDGEGRRLEGVSIKKKLTGTELANVAVNYEAGFGVIVEGIQTVPCTVTVESYGQIVEKQVTAAPAGCERSPTLLKAEWKDETLIVELDGTGNRLANLSSVATGRSIARVNLDDAGELADALEGLAVVPCSLRLEVDGFTFDKEVRNAPANCDATISEEEGPTGTDGLAIGLARWDAGSNELRLGGIGDPTATVNLAVGSTGSSLGSAAVNANGKWSLTLSPTAVPCAIEAASGAQSVTESVVGAPKGCQ